MQITFKDHVPVEDTMEFEQQYEDKLQWSTEDKDELITLCQPTVAYMYIDGKLAGETYGLSPADDYTFRNEEIEDCNINDHVSCYCYSTTILPAYQGLGLGKILKAYWLGLVKARGYQYVIGHATSPTAVSLNRSFGAKFEMKIHQHWYGTDRTAIYYRIHL